VVDRFIEAQDLLEEFRLVEVVYLRVWVVALHASAQVLEGRDDQAHRVQLILVGEDLLVDEL